MDWNLKTCKARALEYLDLSPPDPAAAVGSMVSDMSKGEETRKLLLPSVIAAGQLAAMDGPEAVRKWIEAIASTDDFVSAGTIH